MRSPWVATTYEDRRHRTETGAPASTCSLPARRCCRRTTWSERPCTSRTGPRWPARTWRGRRRHLPADPRRRDAREVATAVLDAATVGKVKDPAGSPNNLTVLPAREGTEWSIIYNADGPAARSRRVPCVAGRVLWNSGRPINLKQSGIQVPPASSKKARLSTCTSRATRSLLRTFQADLAARIVVDANGTTTTVLNLDDNDEGLGYERYHSRWQPMPDRRSRSASSTPGTPAPRPRSSSTTWL